MRKYRRIAFPSHPSPKPSTFANFSAGFAPDVLSQYLVGYETFLAIQLVPDRWRSPEYSLALACLSTGLESLAYHRTRLTTRNQRIYHEERAWLMDDNSRYLYSFLNLCQICGFDADGTRRKVLGP